MYGGVPVLRASRLYFINCTRGLQWGNKVLAEWVMSTIKTPAKSLRFPKMEKDKQERKRTTFSADLIKLMIVHSMQTNIDRCFVVKIL